MLVLVYFLCININLIEKKTGKSEARAMVEAFGFVWSLLSVSILTAVGGYYFATILMEWDH